MSRRAWSAADLVHLRKLRQSGLSKEIIARKLGRTPASIASRIAKDRLCDDYPHANTPHAPGRSTVPAVARRLDAFLRKPAS